ncbi:hypothetical protein [Methylobacterium komagatae]
MTDRPKRKAIPDAVKLRAVLRVEGRCQQCGERLGDLSGLQFDHRPALVNRPVSDDGSDYVPAQLDPEYIEPLHLKCHDTRTNGPGGEKRITTAGSDKHVAAKTKRLAEQRLAPPREEVEAPASTQRPRPSGFPPAQRKGRASKPLDKWVGPSLRRGV